MSLEITEDLIARQSPEAQAIIRLLLAKIEELEAKFCKTPDNSSLPPSSQHPHVVVAVRNSAGMTNSRCVIRCGNFPRSNRSLPNTNNNG